MYAKRVHRPLKHQSIDLRFSISLAQSMYVQLSNYCSTVLVFWIGNRSGLHSSNDLMYLLQGQYGTLNCDQRPVLGVILSMYLLNYSMQKYFGKTKEDHSKKSASGHNWWSLFSLTVETLGLFQLLYFFLYYLLMFFFNFFSGRLTRKKTNQEHISNKI